MNRKLAIKGHSTRGKEVIEILKMMGGVATTAATAVLNGFKESCCYYISEDTTTKYISWDYIGPEEIDKYTIFTLEEFLKKYPHKVGDKVVDGYGDTLTIKSMSWSEDCKTMLYDFKETGDVLAAEDFDLLKWNATNVEESKDCPKAPILSNRYDYAEGKCGYVIPAGYEFDCIREGFQTEIILKPKKPKYPDDYEECVRIAKNIHGYDIHIDTPAYRELMESFVKLLICRDAYWKIAGEEMGLGKSWEPDFTNEKQISYGLFNELKYSIINPSQFVFPTAEMRDAFYENFKKEIEQCKELL